MRWTVTSSRELSNLYVHLGNMPQPFTVDISEGKGRSMSQNALFHAWMGQIAKSMHDDPSEIKAQCHIRWGIPIFRGDDTAYSEFIERALGGKTRADVINMIVAGFIPCTRIMEKATLSKYMDFVWREYSPHVNLMDPENLKWRN